MLKHPIYSKWINKANGSLNSIYNVYVSRFIISLEKTDKISHFRLRQGLDY